MRPITSDALVLINRMLGMGRGGADETSLMDGKLDLALDVNPAVRRGRTIGITEGLFFFLFENTHAGADLQSTTITPYSPAVGAVNGWPRNVPDDLEVWLLGASVEQDTGTGTIEAGLFQFYQGAQQGIGEDEGGGAVTGSALIWLARWTGALVTLSSEHAMDPNGNPWVPIGLRIPRLSIGAGAPTNLIFRSLSTAAAVFTCTAVVGLFPVGLGQDILVGAG